MHIEQIYFMWKIYHPILNSSLRKYLREFLSKIIGGEKNCRKFVENWVKYKGKIEEFTELSLE